MKKKLIKRYLMLCLPFVCGLLLYRLGSYGIVSSLLFFCGGYILIKNIFDYRVVRKNIKKCIDNDKKLEIDIDKLDSVNEIMLNLDRDRLDDDIDKEYINMNNNDYGYEYIKCDNIHGLKSVRIHKKVRRRY